MNTERSQLYYNCVFLHVSFQAIQHSMAGKKNDSLPCWLDTNLIGMLSRELHNCREQAAPFADTREALDTAIYHCGLLLAQCPGSLNSQLCHHHLDAIMAPLKEAMTRLSGNVNRASASRASSPSQRLRSWLGW